MRESLSYLRCCVHVVGSASLLLMVKGTYYRMMSVVVYVSINRIDWTKRNRISY